ncbi:unnamed protein product [Effrenium voratum]|uniref:RBR-type E3 ubiquitin transferase n=1 Tax=Effrenium voratum TaxID=2562239 RepID=A0AA36N9F7_9DINO|nr:unnamed protein product [Effrenium voratum]
MPVCPVCFEDAESVEYATMHNHSWKNHACDGHGLCWRCLAQHVEIQLLEGRYNVRCPGAAGCSYRLVSLDVGRALDVLEREDGKEEVVGTLRLRYEQLRSDCHQHRLRELLKKSQGANEAWLLTRVQPCPRCLTLVRKETGCSHVFCRCGSDFCFPCGAPPGGCICSQMRRPGGSKVVFAAWLRSADESRVEWLWDYRGLVDDNDDDGDEEVEQERLLTTLQFYLWLASAPVPSPLKPLPEPVAVPASTAPPALVEKLPEIRWKKSERKVVAEVVDYDFTFSDPEEEDALAKYYPRVPQKPWRAYASQRQSRQMDRYRARPLRWSEEKVWQKDGDCLRASAPLHRRRQCAYDARQARPGAQRSAEVRRLRKLRQRQLDLAFEA